MIRFSVFSFLPKVGICLEFMQKVLVPSVEYISRQSGHSIRQRLNKALRVVEQTLQHLLAEKVHILRSCLLGLGFGSRELMLDRVEIHQLDANLRHGVCWSLRRLEYVSGEIVCRVTRFIVWLYQSKASVRSARGNAAVRSGSGR